jgi:O-antigen/teichoic acid export membrane protein
MGRFLRDARHLTPANAANYLIGQGDRILLSAFQPSAAVGLYGFAMGISTRPALVLDRSLAIVLMPVLGKLSGQPRRQAAAFVRVTRLLAAITAPICAGIAVAADPLMHAVMHPRWIPTIPILQWLAVATGAGIVTRRYAAMLDIQRRFATRLRLNLLHAGVLVVALVPAAGAGPVSVAATLAFVNLAVGLLKIRIALAGAAEPWRATLSIPAPALAAALPAAGLAWLAAAAVPDEPAGRWIQLLVIPVVLLPAHAILLRLVSRDVFDEARGQVDLVTERLRRRRR